ncbi:class I SAM-dependent methyltransferase [Aestuariicella hydrocarbonica]|uniref:Class I SAM-dependent methyltransferase n=2 Tax=Pseudomaricurvus hydrocarbonicus TaxID=1470433 RepID=A0A9E5JUH4_9GAMM|nr:class I SAM-dependent methyltransferase [Aestuariicella hydrocarbonica]
MSSLGVAEGGIEQAMQSPLRSDANKARDVYRHPAQTLSFFEVSPSSQVVEIWPGSGWYTEILAPLLADKGKLYAAHFAKQSPVSYFQKSRTAFLAMAEAHPDVYGKMEITEFHPPSKVVSGPNAQVDHVLTFRNVHNWMKAGFADEAFTEFYQLLKPNGILGVVEHRAKPGTSMQDMIASGYVTEDEVIRMAEKAGFVLEARSDINANPKDTSVHPAGVWSLPPSLRLGDENRAEYLAIGESDRMTLKFRKP